MKGCLLLLLILTLSACVSMDDIAHVTVGNVTVAAEVADSPDEWQRGLMNRDSLAENSGMLFVFPDEQTRSFWMKNTKIPLDIIFISSDLMVVDIQSMEPCYAEPCKTYTSKEPAKYALEVNKGFAEENGLHAGLKAAIA